MKLFTKSLLLILLVIAIVGCLKNDFRTFEEEMKELEIYLDENNITTEPTWTGLYYIEELEGSGSPVEYLDSVIINFRLKRIDGYEVANTFEANEPVKLFVGDASVIHGLNEVLTYMKEGGKATAIIPSNLGFGANQFTDIPEYSTLIYELEVVEHIPGIAVEEVSTDTLELLQTGSGLKYYKIAVNDSNEVLAKEGDRVKVHYTGYLSNGKIFDSSVKKGSPATFVLSSSSLISGWIEGIQLMKEGEKFRFILPANLAYGENGSFPKIPPNEVLTFDVELIDIF